MSEHRIVDIRTRRVGFSRTPKTLQAHLASPISALPPVEPAGGGSWFGPCAQVIVEVVTDTGLVGVGTAGGFSAVPATVIEQHLRPLVLGADPFNVERNWDLMYRAVARLGISGAVMAGISGIDIACYDIMGKALGVPVYDLVGGRKQERIPVYASRLYALDDLDELADEARRWRDAGFRLVKQRFGFTARDGLAGMRRNVELVRTVREAVGDDVEVAADAYMGWTVEYTLEMIKRLAEFDLKWIEEPLLPHDIDGYRRLCRTSPIPISHGEHQYTRYGFARVIEAEAAHLLQPDVNRVGGLTEARKIFALAAARDLAVIPHSNELHNLHLVVSQPNAPMAEYFPDVEPDTGNELFWKIFEGAPVARDGFVELGDAPGLGLSIRESALEELTTHA
ncbi:enolase C-terminal domain-like protein [Conexibacter sp. CPCC 206217]|uniref:enolase C-terminal domain-like protein n=1 Tax=Conexibacter sp. CPCC 206217 TaxID=3064574 RepID=UPI00271BE554|nr:enolase C-terminal domain-like protein [Conexibacter sp. CPCC 206217]MDO8210046.1 enolase C-terminal domain-like protein [Conexibacter sp. CPCC 206217]